MFRKLMNWKKHHGIEMFGGLLVLCIVALVINSGVILSYAANEDKDYLEGNPYYAEEFVTSKSQTRGTIKAFYTNADNTKVAIMLHFTPITNMSTDAANYQIFYKGFNISKQRYTKRNLNEPVGGYYIFGSTGYAMIYLMDSTGFEQQAGEVVVRSLETLYTNNDSSSEEIESLKQLDASYEEYDQFRLIINPAGAQATVVDFLDDFDVQRVYQQCIVDEQEAEIRARLMRDTVELNELWSRISAFKKNLTEAGVNVTMLPEEIRGDRFVNCPDADGKHCEISSKDLVEDVTTQLVYVPSYVYSGGVDFDWFHEDLHTADFLGPLLGGKTEAAFFQSLVQEKAQYGGMQVDANSFSMLDGTPINLSTLATSSLVTDKQIYDAISEYSSAVNDYIEMKRQYQTVDMVEYLSLQYNMQSTGQTFSANLQDDTVHVW